jgi:hypothetical protein
MAAYKLNEEDDHFLEAPQGALLVASGADGAETWIERAKDATVRVVIASVAVATADGAALEAVIEVDGARAHGSAGPAAADTHLQSIQSGWCGRIKGFSSRPIPTRPMRGCSRP